MSWNQINMDITGIDLYKQYLGKTCDTMLVRHEIKLDSHVDKYHWCVFI